MRWVVPVMIVGILHQGSCAPQMRTTAGGTWKTESARVMAERVAFVGVTVSDIERSIAFYTGVLGFESGVEGIVEEYGDAVEHRTGVFGARTRTARLRLGMEEMRLTQYLAPEGRPIPPDSASTDRWFQHVAIVVADIDRAYATLRAHRVRHASTGPQTLPAWNPDAGGISAFYFKDPDGHVLEVIQFPTGKGHPRWQSPGGRLFLGIDHTAIVVADTRASLAFYHGMLGMRVAGGSENFGTEQEHLSNVKGARVRITTLRAPSGPGVELLEYLAPPGGRPMPGDTRGNDLWHWHTGIEASGVIPSLIQDPDGHALLVLSTPAPQPAQADGIQGGSPGRSPGQFTTPQETPCPPISSLSRSRLRPH